MYRCIDIYISWERRLGCGPTKDQSPRVCSVSGSRTCMYIEIDRDRYSIYI